MGRVFIGGTIMASILEWSHSQPGYLEIASQIDVKKQEETLELIADRLKNALEQEKDFIYATANQVGYPYQVYALRTNAGIEVWANPLMARDDSKMILVYDKEFGLKNNFLTPRWPKIDVVAYSVDKKLVCQREYTNEAAVVMQHIMNNLNGISIKDIGLEMTPEFLTASEEDRKEVVDYYLGSLEKLLNTLEEDIMGDSELGAKYQAFKFVKAKAAGDIKHEKIPNRKTRRLVDKLFRRKKK